MVATEKFDFILVSAVLIFLNEASQIVSITKLISLLKDSGTLIFSIKEVENDQNIFQFSNSFPAILKELNCDYKIIAGGMDSLNWGGGNWNVYVVNKHH